MAEEKLIQLVHRAIMLDADAGADANVYADADDDVILAEEMEYSRQAAGMWAS